MTVTDYGALTGYAQGATIRSVSNRIKGVRELRLMEAIIILAVFVLVAFLGAAAEDFGIDDQVGA